MKRALVISSFAGNRRRALLAGILLAPSLLAFAAPSKAASFDCNAKGLQPDEQTICDNRVLNDDDVKMVTTFDLLSGLLAMGARGAMQDEQTAWLKKRQACGKDVECIAKAYDERMVQLKEAYKNINRPL